MRKFYSLIFMCGAFIVASCSNDDDDSPVPVDPTSFTGDISIVTPAQLASAVELGERLTTINGDVYIRTGSGITAAEVSEVTDVIASVTGNLTVINPDGSVNLSALTTVGGTYRVVGTDVQDNALTSAGDVYLSYDGEYNMPALTSAGEVVLADLDEESKAVRNVTGVLFPALVTNNIFRTASHRAGMINLPNATSIDVEYGAEIDYVDAPVAVTIVIEFTGSVNNLFINAPNATTITIKITTVTGDMQINAGASTNVEASSVTSVGGDCSVVGGNVDLSNMTTVGGNLDVQGESVSQGTGRPDQHNSGGN